MGGIGVELVLSHLSSPMFLFHFGMCECARVLTYVLTNAVLYIGSFSLRVGPRNRTWGVRLSSK